LTNDPKFEPVKEEVKFTTLCIDYLNLPSCSDTPTEAWVFDGSYGFMEYSVLNWTRHLESSLRYLSGDEKEDLSELAESLGLFLDLHYYNDRVITLRETKRTTAKLQILEPLSTCPDLDRLEKAITSTKLQMRSFGEVEHSEIVLNLADVILSIRNMIETLLLNLSSSTMADKLALIYGAHHFKCPRFSCKYFIEGFASMVEREAHVDKHLRPARCADTHCTGYKYGFVTKAQLQKHLRDVHGEGVKDDQTFPTEHDISESKQTNVIQTQGVQITGTEQLNIDSNDLDGNATISLSSSDEEQIANRGDPRHQRHHHKSFPCHACPEVFNKRFNLISHLRTHSSEQGTSFKCGVCGIQLARKSDYTRHMRKHSGVSIYQCRGCRNDFLRADVLTNHHKSKKGKECLSTVGYTSR
jgi:hypothetical protein